MRIQTLVLLVAAFSASWSVAGEIRVELDGSGDFLDIQSAVNAAAPGDTIIIGPGRFGTLQPSCVAAAWTEDAIVTITQDDLTIIGSGVDSTVLGKTEFYYSNSSDPKAICSVDGNSAMIRDLTIENMEQGIYWAYGQLIVDNCVIRGGHASFRGIVALMDYGSIRNTRVELGGGGIAITSAYSDSLEISNCRIEGWGTGFSTGAEAGKISISDCQFLDNSYGLTFAYGAYGSVRNVELTNIYANALQVVHHFRSVVMESVFVDGASTGLVVSGASGGSFEGTGLIIENTTVKGVELWANAIATIKKSHLLPADGVAIRCAGYAGGHMVLDFTENYWGTSVPDSISEMIVDSADDPALEVTVQFEPFAIGPVPAEKTSFGSVKSMFR